MTVICTWLSNCCNWEVFCVCWWWFLDVLLLHVYLVLCRNTTHFFIHGLRQSRTSYFALKWYRTKAQDAVWGVVLGIFIMFSLIVKIFLAPELLQCSVLGYLAQIIKKSIRKKGMMPLGRNQWVYQSIQIVLPTVICTRWWIIMELFVLFYIIIVLKSKWSFNHEVTS